MDGHHLPGPMDYTVGSARLGTPRITVPCVTEMLLVNLVAMIIITS